MPRFVVLKHDHPTLHWDLMLEHGALLRTWRLAAVPADGLSIVATALGDHRLAYLDYEGPVSGNRGQVTRWDRGEYEASDWQDDKIVVRLAGARLTGNATLRQESGDEWRFVFAVGAPPLGGNRSA
jgi:hypothetical protein